MSHNKIVHDLNSLSDRVKEKFIAEMMKNSLPVERVKGLENGDLASKIVKYFGYFDLHLDDSRTEYGQFKNQIFSSISKEPLRKILTGVYTFDHETPVLRDLPSECLEVFCKNPGWGKWSLVYLIGGIADFESNPSPTIDAPDFYAINASLIKRGMSGILHSKNPTTKKSYARIRQLPHARNILKHMPGLEDMADPAFSRKAYLIDKADPGNKQR